MGKDYQRRENVDRSVFLSGEICEDLAQRLTPGILKLRSTSTKPITVYINSPGGDVRLSNSLRDLITCPNADGDSYWLITVVTNLAASAAADFLASGDYAIAYQGSIIHCHGVRVPRMQELTMERASDAARKLRDHNEDRAGRFARHMINRIIFIYLSSINGFRKYQASDSFVKSDFDCFNKYLTDKISTDNKVILHKSKLRFEEIRDISAYVFSKLKNHKIEKIGLVKFEGLLLKSIIDYEIKIGQKNKDIFYLDDDRVLRIAEDFKLLKDYHTGVHNTWFLPVIDRWKQFFVDNKDANEFDGKDEDKKNELIKHVKRQLWPIWYFTICIARALQESENSLTDEDAYWLGIVDEVLGSNLPCPRIMTELAFGAEKNDTQNPD